MKQIIKFLKRIQKDCRSKMTDLDQIDEDLEDAIDELEDLVKKGDLDEN